MSRNKMIYRSPAWLKNYCYRATSNGETVSLQERHINRMTWRTIRKITIKDWEAWADSMRLDDSYNDNLQSFQTFVLAK